jgi:cation:H+ antiporter
MLFQVLLLFLALVLLFFGAELALNAAEKIGEKLGLSPMIIGMLIIGLGTSLPEFFVSHLAMMKGDSGMALGNIVGSNVANTLLILGITSFLIPLRTDRADLKQFVLHFILYILLLFALSFSTFNFIGSSILLTFFLFFLFNLFLDRKKDLQREADEHIERPAATFELDKEQVISFIKLALGFYSLYFGGELLVDSGTEVCKMIGISTYVISAIFVAFGTSFPELVTSVIACKKGKDTDIIIGNILGSNIFNVAFVLGSLGFYKFKIEISFHYELIALFASAALLLFMSYRNARLNRILGSIFLLGYVYMVYYWVGK